MNKSTEKIIENLMKCGISKEDAQKIYDEHFYEDGKLRNRYGTAVTISNKVSIFINEDTLHFEFYDETSIKKITEDEIELTNGMTIWALHVEDCCENVYAELDTLSTEIGNSFDSLTFRIVPDMGFLFNKSLVCCHNEQNGYYSSDLELRIRWEDISITFDISEGTIDDIY